MEASFVPSQLTVKSPIVRGSGRNPGWVLPGLVKLCKYPTNSRHLPTRLCLATANGGEFRQDRRGVGSRDGVILVDHGSRRKESNLMLNEFVTMFIKETGYRIVEPAHMDIPSLTADAAKEHPGVSYIITAPLGLHGLLVDVVNDRIRHCLSHVAGDVEECSVCAGTGKCRLHQST